MLIQLYIAAVTCNQEHMVAYKIMITVLKESVPTQHLYVDIPSPYNNGPHQRVNYKVRKPSQPTSEVGFALVRQISFASATTTLSTLLLLTHLC